MLQADARCDFIVFQLDALYHIRSPGAIGPGGPRVVGDGGWCEDIIVGTSCMTKKRKRNASDHHDRVALL
jgi:hypothetical protein